MNSPTQQVVADAGAAASATLAGITWIAELNVVLQLIATIVAIVAGLGAAWWHFERARAAYKDRKESK
jgi:hypothetical protein